MKRPLVQVALWFTGGIWIGQFLVVPWPVLLLVVWLWSLVYLSWPRAQARLLGPMLWLAGLAHYGLCTAVISPHDVRLLLGEEPVLVEVQGRLEGALQHRQSLPASPGRNRDRFQARLRLSFLRMEGRDWRPAHGCIVIQTPGIPAPGLHSGQTVRVQGVMARPPGAMAPGLFDYRAYLGRQGVYFQLQTGSLQDWRWPSSPAGTPEPWSERFVSWARATLARGLPEGDEAVGLLWAMTLGWRTALNGEVAEPFMQSGTMHVFAISGLHVGMVAAMLVGLLRGLGCSARWNRLLVLPLLWFYAWATGWHASAVRATLMITVLMLGRVLARPADSLNSLAAAAVVILLWDPLQLFQLGFQLSFAVVMTLALAEPHFRRWGARWLEPDPFLIRAWQRAREGTWTKLARGVLSVLGISLAAWLGSLPLVLYHFHYFNPVAIAANVVIVQVALLALSSSLASLATGAWWDGASELFNHSGWFWMTSMIWLSRWAAALPGGWCHVAAPPFGLVMAYYVLLAGGCTTWQRPGRGRWWWVTGMAFLIAGFIMFTRASVGGLQMQILAARGGQALVCHGPGRSEAWLIDVGDEQAAQAALVPFLRAKGINRLSGLILTHGDARHVGGWSVLAAVDEEADFYLGPSPFRSPAYRQARAAAQAAGRLRILEAGQTVGPWHVLYPDGANRLATADDQPLVLWGRFYGTRVLLISDLSFDGQDALLEAHPELRAEVVVSGLPAGSQPLADLFLDVVQPELIVVCDSLYPAPERAGPGVRERLARYPGRVCYLHQTGGLTLKVGPEGWSVQSRPDHGAEAD